MHRRSALIKPVTALREAQGGGPGRTAQLELVRGSGLGRPVDWLESSLSAFCVGSVLLVHACIHKKRAQARCRGGR
jgi:hypothetical protein